MQGFGKRVINIRVQASTPEQALLTLEAVIDAVLLKLDERQRGVDAPVDSLMGPFYLTRCGRLSQAGAAAANRPLLATRRPFGYDYQH